jgi:hypothetical protein
MLGQSINGIKSCIIDIDNILYHDTYNVTKCLRFTSFSFGGEKDTRAAF